MSALSWKRASLRTEVISAWGQERKWRHICLNPAASAAARGD
jgi:hypothetical protein